MNDYVLHMRSTKAAGNFKDDKELWISCHNVAKNENLPMEVRLESLAKMNELTGEDEPCTVEALEDYLITVNDDNPFGEE